LRPGAQLGPYHIISGIGAGGMGEVYRGRDTKLNRDVAIKVLPDLFAADPKRLARFSREAQTLAALSHTNVAHVYGVIDRPAALVMEFAEGEDLSAIIARGPLAPADALAIARQIADALEAAHERGIVHRDLKPANVKVAADGAVKVLDFGLAKAMDPSSGLESPNAMNSPTFTAHATRVGVIMGTAAYMSPEQARGKAVDKRADIWAFGVVLFEMLTGQRVFDGDEMSDVIASVLRDGVPWDRLPAETPPRLRRLLERCLERDVKQRLRDIGEARIEIGKMERGDPDTAAPPTASVTAARPAAAVSPTIYAPWIVAAVAVIGAAIVTLRPISAPAALSIEATIGPPAGRTFQLGSTSGSVALSPDGTTIAFVAAAADGSNDPVLWVRPIDRDEPRALPGTKGASYQFWAPDSRSLAFFADRKLRTIEISGGLPQAIADIEDGRGGCWSDSGRIFFTPVGGGRVFSVASSGGAVTPVTTLNAAHAENANYWPTCLPGGKHVLYFARSQRAEFNGVYFTNADGTGAPVQVVSSLSSAIYVPPSDGRGGYLLWARDTVLLAQPFDADSGRLTGQAVPIATDVLVEESQRGLMAAASRTGTLLWASARGELLQFAWFDRSGRRLLTMPIEPGRIYTPSVSQDMRSILFYRAQKGGADVWLHTFADGTTRRLTNELGYNQNPAWIPGGQAILYLADSGMNRLGFDGTTSAIPLSTAAQDLDLLTVTADGRFAVSAAGDGHGGRNLWAFALAPPYAPTRLLSNSAEQSDCNLSPDGRWLMWHNVEGGRESNFLARFRTSGAAPQLGEQRISLGEGDPIGWRADGGELYVLRKWREVVAIPVTLGAETASVGSAATLFTIAGVPRSVNPAVVPAPDGQRFVVTEAPYAQDQTLHVLTNWTSRLRAGNP
jgi:Tol biopolymer transport system component